MATAKSVGRTRGSPPASRRPWATRGPSSNVGAGSGSYEPAGRDVIAVEPSQTMIAQRPAGAAPVVQARGRLTFDPPPLAEHWLVRDNVPRLYEIHAETMGPIAELTAALRPSSTSACVW